ARTFAGKGAPCAARTWSIRWSTTPSAGRLTWTSSRGSCARISSTRPTTRVSPKWRSSGSSRRSEEPGRQGSTRLLQQRSDLLDQLLELNRLGLEVVAAGGERLVAALLRNVGGHDDDGDTLRFRLVLQAARRLPAVQPRKPQVHDDEIGLQGLRPVDSLRPV